MKASNIALFTTIALIAVCAISHATSYGAFAVCAALTVVAVVYLCTPPIDEQHTAAA